MGYQGIIRPFGTKEACPYIEALRHHHPLVHLLTNHVVMNFTANLILAAGASPAMVIAPEEVEHFAAVADALLINVGTVTQESSRAMLLAVQSANRAERPWVLDPVAVGPILSYRSDLVATLLKESPAVIRGNPSEIRYLAGEESAALGPDSLESSDRALDSALRLANKYQTIVAVTGEKDYITDGESIYQITVGSNKLSLITGAGCALSALVAAFLGIEAQLNKGGSDRLSLVASALYMVAKAGQLANDAPGLGSFQMTLIDHLSNMPNNLRECGGN